MKYLAFSTQFLRVLFYMHACILTAFYVLGEILGFRIFYWYVPAYTWFASLIVMYGIFVRRLVKKKMIADLIYMPIYFVFSFHWLIEFLQSLTVKTWAETKTKHGYITT